MNYPEKSGNLYQSGKSKVENLPFLETRWEFRLRSLVRGLVRIYVPATEISPWPTKGKVYAVVYPDDKEDLRQVLRFAELNHVPWIVLGSGDHVILKDGDFFGIIIKIKHTFYLMKNYCETGDEIFIEVGAGVSLPEFLEWARNFDFENLDALYGITGSIGGALWRNAGNGDFRLRNFISEITVLGSNGDEIKYRSEDLRYDFGQLFLPERGIVISAIFRFKKKGKTFECTS